MFSFRSCSGLLASAMSLIPSGSSRLVRTCCALIAITMLASCGFKPVYKKNTAQPSVHQDLIKIEVPLLKGDRTNQLFSTSLMDALDPQSQGQIKTYRLDIQVKRNREPAIIQQDREITRYRVIVEAPFKLIDKATGRVLLSDSIKLRSSYDDLNSEFANYSSQVDAEERAAKELAEMVRQRLITYFGKR